MTAPDQPPGSGGFLDQLGEAAGELGNLAHATGASAVVPPGGYSFEPDQLIDIAQEWESLADAYEADILLAKRLTRVEGPGAEYASGDNAQVVRQSGEALVSALGDRVDYCRAQAEKFRSAAGQYAEAEASAGDEIGNQGGSL
ncbi:hypothetical protein ACPZ19_04115 [Amycolatopsis lurida]